MPIRHSTVTILLQHQYLPASVQQVDKGGVVFYTGTSGFIAHTCADRQTDGQTSIHYITHSIHYSTHQSHSPVSYGHQILLKYKMVTKCRDRSFIALMICVKQQPLSAVRHKSAALIYLQASAANNQQIIMKLLAKIS